MNNLDSQKNKSFSSNFKFSSPKTPKPIHRASFDISDSPLPTLREKPSSESPPIPLHLKNSEIFTLFVRPPPPNWPSFMISWHGADCAAYHFLTLSRVPFRMKYLVQECEAPGGILPCVKYNDNIVNKLSDIISMSSHLGYSPPGNSKLSYFQQQQTEQIIDLCERYISVIQMYFWFWNQRNYDTGYSLIAQYSPWPRSITTHSWYRTTAWSQASDLLSNSEYLSIPEFISHKCFKSLPSFLADQEQCLKGKRTPFSTKKDVYRSIGIKKYLETYIMRPYPKQNPIFHTGWPWEDSSRFNRTTNSRQRTLTLNMKLYFIAQKIFSTLDTILEMAENGVKHPYDIANLTHYVPSSSTSIAFGGISNSSITNTTNTSFGGVESGIATEDIPEVDSGSSTDPILKLGEQVYSTIFFSDLDYLSFDQTQTQTQNGDDDEGIEIQNSNTEYPIDSLQGGITTTTEEPVTPLKNKRILELGSQPTPIVLMPSSSDTAGTHPQTLPGTPGTPTPSLRSSAPSSILKTKTRNYVKVNSVRAVTTYEDVQQDKRTELITYFFPNVGPSTVDAYILGFLSPLYFITTEDPALSSLILRFPHLCHYLEIVSSSLTNLMHKNHYPCFSNENTDASHSNELTPNPPRVSKYIPLLPKDTYNTLPFREPHLGPWNMISTKYPDVDINDTVLVSTILRQDAYKIDSLSVEKPKIQSFV